MTADHHPPRPTSPAPVLLRAAWVAPMDGPPVRDGGVVMAGGRVAVVGDARALAGRFPEATVHDAGEAVVLPGLVNAHVHLELSDLHPGAPPGGPAGFVPWLLRVMGGAASPGQAGRERVVRATAAGVAECLQFGVTTVGDITRRPDDTRPVIAGSALRAVSYGEVVGMAGRRGAVETFLERAVGTVSSTGGNVSVGVSPHAPYSIEPAGYRRCLDVAWERGLPLTTHLAESPDEAAFLADHAGPFRELWAALGAWDDDVPRFAGGPVRLAGSLGLLEYAGTLLAHVNYCDDAEMNLLAAGRAGVVYCPRTHAYFGHPPHRWREMLARGMNVAVGTDSRASSPDLNLVDDLRLIHRLAPEVPPAVLWEMATVRAARAIGRGNEVGTLSPGKAADVAVFRAVGDDPLGFVLENDISPAQVWARGDQLHHGSRT